GAPQVADVLGPLPRLVLAPLADAVHDRGAGLAQRGPRLRVPLDGGHALVVAVVVLEVGDAPLGERLRVDVLEPEPAREPGAVTGLGASTGVDAELETLAVHVVGDVGDP